MSDPLADLIAAHRLCGGSSYDAYAVTCSCGPTVYGHRGDARGHAAHVAAVIRAAQDNDTETDRAEYGPIGHDAPPSEVVCLTCGQTADRHTRGRFTLYGTCPPDAARAGLATQQRPGHEQETTR